MGPHAWENELARHIVSVYNNKAVSDVKVPESSMRQKKESSGPKEISNLPSKLAQDFFNHAPQSSFHEPEESLPPDTKVKQFDRSSFADISSNEKILNQTKQLMKSTNPQMIWLCGTGDASHWDWDELKGEFLLCHPHHIKCIQIFQVQSFRTDTPVIVLKSHNSIALKKVYFERKYIKYIMIVKSEICSLIASSRLKRNARKQDQLWRKLVLSANGFASKLIEEGKYSQAIEILEIASNLLSVDYIKSEVVKQELDGLLKDTHAYYYSRRSKPSAALQYIIGAANTKKQMIVLTDKTNCNLRKIPTPIDLAKCHLHRACVLQQLHRFEDAIKFMQRVLTMVDTYLGDDGHANTSTSSDALQGSKMRRIVGEEDAEITLLVAVTHHNIAVIQILMGHIGDACISSQNCRRLSRLCMSISSRYVAQFEETHMKALCELSRMLSSKQTKDEALVFQKLVLELFD
jgi:tetratricopeptide (TPR) repeat protein